MKPAEWWRRLRQLAHRDQFTPDLEEEMRLHVELRARRNRARGLPDDEAMRQARIRFGNTTLLKEDAHRVWVWSWTERLGQDIRYGLRQMSRRGMSSAAVVAILALGIGANTAMFTMVNTMLFAPPPGDAPDRLAWIVVSETPSGRLRTLSSADVRRLEQAPAPFESVTSYSAIDLSLSGATPERVRGLIVSANYFDVIGVRPALGRAFRGDEDREAAGPAVILSEGLWRRRFGGDPAIVNQPVVLNGRPFTVVGIAPRGFGGIELSEGEPIGAWVPMGTIAMSMPGRAGSTADDEQRWLSVVGRLAAGRSMSEADAAMRLVEFPSRALSHASQRAVLMAAPIQGGLDLSNRRDLAAVFALFSIVPVLVLVVACANAANLMLARGVDRRREIALRRSLGASRGRVIGQLMTESLMLAVGGGVLGVLLANGLISLIGIIGGIPDNMLALLTIDRRVLLATAGVAALTGVLFGTAPAYSASNPDLTLSLKDESGTTTASRKRRRLRGALVVCQVGVSLALLVVAGLVITSLSRTLRVDPGFDTKHALTLSFNLQTQAYAPAAQSAFLRALLQRAVTVPGVEHAAITDTVPMGGRYLGTDISPDGPQREERKTFSFMTAVSADYFEALGVPLVRGRSFDERDEAADAPVVIVNEALAKRFWPDADPIGQRVELEGDHIWRAVVGVARNSRFRALDESGQMVTYRPIGTQPPAPAALIARTSFDPGAAIGPLTAAVHELDRNLPVVSARPLADLPLLSVDAQRASSSLLLVFGGLALVLAVVGIYGLASHAARLRTREAGIRVALGARPSDLHRLFMGEGLRLTTIGIALGVLLGLAATTLLSSFLFGLGAADALVFVAAAIALGVTAAAASYFPARRAARVDPLIVLRTE